MTRSRKMWLIICLALFLVIPSAPAETRRVYFAREAPPFDENAPLLHLYVADLVGADCMLLILEGHSMLIDMGKENQVPQILSLLDAVGVSSVDHAFNTHPHSDHLGGMIQLLDHLDVERFYTCFAEDACGSAMVQRQTIPVLREHGIPIIHMTQDDIIPFGEALVRVFHQPKAKTVNQRSAMLHITYGECSILLAADVSEVTQTRFGERYDLKADILKYPHHGLGRLNYPFLRSVAPEYTFFTHGSSNSLKAQEQMDREGIPYSFAAWGPIHLSTDGQIWRVDQWVNESFTKIVKNTIWSIASILEKPAISERLLNCARRWIFTKAARARSAPHQAV